MGLFRYRFDISILIIRVINLKSTLDYLSTRIKSVLKLVEVYPDVDLSPNNIINIILYMIQLNMVKFSNILGISTTQVASKLVVVTRGCMSLNLVTAKLTNFYSRRPQF